ncbi:hypothetical protein [Roseiterribacter gracilis]
MQSETLFARAVLVPPAKVESRTPSLARDASGDRLREPRNLLQRATQRL